MNKFILSFMILIFSFMILIHPKQSHAAGVDTLLKVAAGSEGERIIFGMAEKAGVKGLTKEARQKAVERWNLELYNKVQEAEATGKLYEARELERLNNMVATVQPADLVPSTTNGYSKFVLSTAMFLTGADIIYDIYSTMNTAREQQKQIELMDDVSIGLQNGEFYTSMYGFSFIDNYGYNSDYQTYSWMVNSPSGTHTIYSSYKVSAAHAAYFTLSSTKNLYFHQQGNDYRNFPFVVDNLIGNFSSVTNPGNFIKSSPVPSVNDFSLPTTVDPLLDPLRSPGVQTIPATETDPVPVPVPQTYPQTVDIAIPDTASYPDTVDVPWNQPLTELAPVPVPDPVPTVDPLWDWLKNLIDSIIEWLKKIWEAITSIPQLILDGIASLFVPAQPVTSLFEPMVTDYKAKFNVISDFNFLKTSFNGSSCGMEDKYIDLFGKHMKILDASFVLQYSTWFKPIISGFMWFMFGWWLFRRMNMIASKNGGVSW